MTHRRLTRIATATLLGGASLSTLGATAHAQSVLFSTSSELATGATLDTGREISVASGTVQIRLAGGAVASFVDSAQFALRDDGSVDLRSGSVTVVGASGATVAVHLPDGVRGSVAGASAATFTANATGARGSTTAGSVAITANGVTRSFTAGQFWTAGADRAPDRVIAGSAAAVPGVRPAGPVRAMAEGGIVAAAENGIPIALGEGLAGVGARGDVVAAARRIEAFDANPTIAAFPTGDYTLLIQYAAQANGLLGAGGTTFNGAGADIIRTYFEYLAAGNAGGNFRTAYAQVLLNYLDLLRSGVLPSTFRGATQAQLTAYLAFIGRTDGFGTLSAANRQLLDAYLAFLSTSGSPDAFGASVTNLTTSFLNFVRAGGNPAGFTQASATVVSQYLAIVQSGGLRTNLTAQNQALLAAYLANNGIGFTTSYATGLAAFVAYLNAGGLPSAYTALPAATVRSYLETLETTGLFDSVLGAQSAFLRSYLVFLRGGGTADQFNALPINVARVNASNLSLYVEYLLAGGSPTAYTALTQAQIRAALDQLTAAGQFTELLGINGAFLGEYYAYIRTGADADTFAGLPSVDVNAYAASLSAFAAYLRAGNLPSSYGVLTAQQIRSYLTALQVGGRLGLLGADQGLLADYLTYVRTGGAPDAFAGLPIVTYTGYASALSAYFTYLNAGGLPSGYTALTQALLRSYLDVLRANEQFRLLGNSATFYTDYLAFLMGGGAVDAFAGLPIVTFQGYASALSAYFAYLNAGGLPSGYTALTQAQVRQYLDALSANAQLTALLGGNAAFFTQYRAYLLTGASVDAFAGLPIVTYQSYATALNAYYAFLAGGGSPSAYTALTQAQIRTYLDTLKVAGQVTALLGTNSAFFTQYLAFLESGGAANAYPGLPSSTYGQYASALSAYFSYLDAGGLPSGYTALTQAQIREYLSVLQANNQLAALLGGNATFFASYLTYVGGGGAPDAFTGLPIVTYRNYAGALTAYYAFLASGGLPANYTALTQAQVRQYLDALAAANQIGTLLGANAAFFTSYQAYLASGGAPDAFTGLPAVTFAQYGTSLQAFVAFLRGNGLPGSYTALTSAQIREYLAVLQANGQLGLIGSAGDQQLVSAYATYLASGGLPNQFTGLPAFVTYEAALRTYYAFLQGGGRPSAYSALSQAQVVAYVQALDAAGLITAKLTATEAKFLRDYAAYVSTGSNPDQFAGLPGNVPTPAPVVTQGLANAPRGSTGNLGLASAGKGLQTAASTSGNVVLSGNNVAAFSGANGVTTQSAKTVEARTVDGTIAIARLSDGTYNTLVGNTATANEGVHLVWGTPATSVPTTGTVAYGLVSATQPTVEGGAVAPGSFSGNLAVDLASRRVGWDSVIGIGGVTYRFASDGGTAAPSLALVGNSNTFSGSASTANTGLAGTGAGFLSGAGGVYAGFSYTATAPIGAVTGAAIFGKGQPVSTLPAVTYVPAPGVTPDLPKPNYAYAAGLQTSGLTVRSSYPGASNAASLTSQAGAGTTRDAAGALLTSSNASTQDLTRLTAKATDVYGDTRALIGRWYDGTFRVGPTNNAALTLSASQGLHYVQMAPPSTIVPTSGQVNYSLLAATQPTYNTGATGAGLFDGRMALLFGSAVKVALEGTIRMPEASGTVTYAFSTPGGVAGVSGLATQTVSNNVIAVTAPMTGSGLACTTNCMLNFSGGFAGTADFNRIGAVYFTSDSRSAAPSIQGAAIFTGTPVPSGITSLSGQRVTFVSAPNSNFGAADPVELNAAGAIQRLNVATGTNTFADYRIGTATAAESGKVDGVMAWTRWSNGSASGFTAIGPNEGIHIVSGTPATALPTSGTVAYSLIGSTKPTDETQRGTPGTLTGSAAVLFGAAPRVGLDLNVAVSGKEWKLATQGGVTNVAQSQLTVSTATMGFTTQQATLSGVSGGACTAFCSGFVQGNLYGAGASNMGLTYVIDQGSGASRNYVTGSAAFAAAPATGGGGAGFTGSVAGQTTLAYSGGSLVDAGSGTVTYDAGKIKTYQSILTARTITAGIAQESGRLADTIGWARWTGDSAGPSTNQGPNAGVHVMSGTPTVMSTLPTSGTASYTLAGSTKPSLAAPGSATGAPGVITGSLAVAFGATPRVGFDLTTIAGEFGWRVATAGGSSNPGQSAVTISGQGAFSATFNKNIGTVTATTGASCVTGCGVTVGGQLYGAGASHIGVAVNVLDTGPTGTAAASGIAIFAKAP